MEPSWPRENWISYSLPVDQARLRLFCFPYAGGGASIFRSWEDRLPAGVQLNLVQLPGRENRLREKPFDRLRALIHTLTDTLGPYLADLPFAFFGHSMGALISFELARELRKNNTPGPVRLYVSGYRAPQLPDPNPPIHDLPDAEFVTELQRMEGMPAQVSENEELMQLFLPTLRADFSLCETYIHITQRPMSCPIVAFGGTEDQEVSRQDLEAWREQTEAHFRLWMLPGNHFFLHSAHGQLLKILAADLNQVIQSEWNT